MTYHYMDIALYKWSYWRWFRTLNWYLCSNLVCSCLHRLSLWAGSLNSSAFGVCKCLCSLVLFWDLWFAWEIRCSGGCRLPGILSRLSGFGSCLSFSQTSSTKLVSVEINNISFFSNSSTFTMNYSAAIWPPWTPIFISFFKFSAIHSFHFFSQLSIFIIWYPE